MFWMGLADLSLLRGRFCALRAFPVADKCLAKFVLLSLILGIGATGHAECFSNAVHGAVKGKLIAKLR